MFACFGKRELRNEYYTVEVLQRREEMEELLELKQLLHEGRLDEALQLVNELEEMSLSDKINKIDSYGVILLIHLIKQNAEKRSTRS